MSDLNGFDMVVSVSAEMINAQLQSLYEGGYLNTTTDTDFSSVGINASITGTLGVPSVNIDDDQGSSPTDLIFLQPISSGTFTLDGTALAFTNWVLAFRVNMAVEDRSIQQLSDAVSAGDIPPDALDGVQSLQSELGLTLGINALVLDFNSLSAASFDSSDSSFPLPGVPDSQVSDTVTQIGTTLTSGFKAMIGSSESYVLGYPLTSSPSTSTVSGAPSYLPTALTFSTSHDLGSCSSLNYLLMVQGDAAPTASSALMFSSPLITDPDEGTYLLDAHLIFDQLLSSLGEPYGSYSLSQWSRNGASWTLKNASVTKGDLKGGQITITVTAANNSSHVTISYRYTMTQKVTVLFFIPAGDVTQTATWNATFNFSISDNVLTGSVISSTDPDISYDQDKDLWAELVDLFVPIVGFTDAIDDLVQLSSFPDVNSSGDWLVGTAPLTLVLPTGGLDAVSPLFNNQGDLKLSFRL